MSKIARRLGRVSKSDVPESSDAPPTSGEGEGGQEDLVQSANHSLKVPTPRMNHKKLKSMSTSHLETSYDGYVYTIHTIHVWCVCATLYIRGYGGRYCMSKGCWGM